MVERSRSERAEVLINEPHVFSFTPGFSPVPRMPEIKRKPFETVYNESKSKSPR